jgi:hypothetical protein
MGRSSAQWLGMGASWNSRLTEADRSSLAAEEVDRTTLAASAAENKQTDWHTSPNLAPGSSIWRHSRRDITEFAGPRHRVQPIGPAGLSQPVWGSSKKIDNIIILLY